MKNLKQNIVIRGLIGALGGVFIGQVVCIVISLCIGKGEVVLVPELLAQQAGNELNAFIWQNVACMFFGSVWAIASVVWELEGWSLAKQTLVHGLTCSLSALPVAWLMHWFPHTWPGFLGYCASFVAMYIGIWLGQIYGMRRRVKAMNAKLNVK